jgi:hypothetical protein
VAHERAILRTAASLAIAGLIAACSAAAAPNAAPALSPTAAPAPTASPASSITPTPSAALATAAPSRKPRPSLDIDPAELDAYLTSSITFLDLADEDLAVVVMYVDASIEQPLTLGTYTLESMDQVTNEAPPGTYVLEFHQPANSTSATSCTIEIADAQGYVFAALGDAIAISATGTAPTDAGELFVATSSLCIA